MCRQLVLSSTRKKSNAQGLLNFLSPETGVEARWWSTSVSVAGSQLSRALEQVSRVKEETDPPGGTCAREVKHLLECSVDQSLIEFPAAKLG